MEDLILGNGRELFRSHHNQWKVQQLQRDRQKVMFQDLELKKVVRETGLVEWFGCRRDTPRCFGSVIDDMPQYLWEGKWTPPCCLGIIILYNSLSYVMWFDKWDNLIKGQ